MKKIMVAGAGHGGLTAAYNLSKAGYDVTVIEKQLKKDLGYDWHDCLDATAFEQSGLKCPPKNMVLPAEHSYFVNPSETVTLDIPMEYRKGFSMDRKLLLKYLIKNCMSVGVKFIYGCEVSGAITKGDKVIGLEYKKGNKVISESCDLLIDAAGMNTPVRRKLPPCFGIQNEIPPEEAFHVYRIYLNNLTGEMLDPEYRIDLFHLNKPGIDWVITRDGCVDILVGKFGTQGELTNEEIEESIAAYRKKYPFIGDKVLRGGSRGIIPLTRMLPMLVADGYALVGDSAGMTFPLNGSGIVLSMKAGKILADKVIAAGEGSITKKALWEYQYEYFQNYGRQLIAIHVLKNFFSYCKGRHVDTFLEKGILKAEHLAVSDGAPLDITPEFILYIIKVSPSIIDCFPLVVKYLKGLPFIDIVADKMPKTYDEHEVRKWLDMYNAL